jgi:type IV pilus assembly protein PilV
MPAMNAKHLPSNQRGMMLLEVLIAILIFSIGVLGMVKMQAISTANSVNSEDRATAALLANDLISEIWAQWAATKSISVPADYLTGWKPLVTSTLNSGVGTLAIAGTTATVTVQWSRQLGRNVEFGVNAATDPEKTATYTTQVVFQ